MPFVRLSRIPAVHTPLPTTTCTSIQTRSQACRNVKFAPAPLDLMAFTEHRGRTHLVDMRMWGRHQVLHLGSGPGHDPEISGLAFSPSGQSLYVGLPEGIARFAIDAQSRFSFPAAEVC